MSEIYDGEVTKGDGFTSKMLVSSFILQEAGYLRDQRIVIHEADRIRRPVYHKIHNFFSWFPMWCRIFILMICGLLLPLALLLALPVGLVKCYRKRENVRAAGTNTN